MSLIVKARRTESERKRKDKEAEEEEEEVMKAHGDSRRDCRRSHEGSPALW